MAPKRINSSKDGSNKRSRKAITLEVKLDVLRRFKEGEKLSQISGSLNLATSTVATIRDNEAKIIAQAESAAPRSAKKLTRHRSNVMERMEKLLGLWIENNNQRKIPMSTIMIQEKARTIFEKLKESNVDGNSQKESFSASKGWLEKFKKRQNLHNINTKGKAASALENDKYIPEIMFNVDEIGLYYPPEEHEKEENVVNITEQLIRKDLSNALLHFEKGIKILRKILKKNEAEK